MGHKLPLESCAFDPDGAVFISYRHIDGSELANHVAWVLRGCGLPVWLDAQDLLPGDFNERITQAFDEGISAAVVVITADVMNSSVMKNIEIPRILELHRVEPRFSLAVINGAPTIDDVIDYAAPDKLLELNYEPLRNTKQYEPTDEGLEKMAVDMARRRLFEFRRHARHALPIDIQTRGIPQAADARTGLSLRYRSDENTTRIPPPDAYQSLCNFLAATSQLLIASGASEVEVTGSAHLSIAFGFGVTFSSVRHVPVTVIQDAERWYSESDGSVSEIPLTVEMESISTGSGRLAVYVDVAEHTGDRTAFDTWMNAHRSTIHRQLVVLGPNDRLKAAAGQKLAEQIAGAIRGNALPLGHGHVDLFLRCSFPVAVLLGRLLNTLTVTIYEWDNSTSPASYMQVATYEYGPRPVKEIFRGEATNQ